MTKKYCSECGAELTKSSKFCPSCGFKLIEETPIKEIQISKRKLNFSKKNKIIIGIIIIVIAIALMFIVLGGFCNSPSHIKDVKVSKVGKVYRIDYTCDIGSDKIQVRLLKDGETLYTSKGNLGEFGSGNSVSIELVKDVDIDEISFFVYDEGYKIIDKGSVKDFEITKKNNLQDIGVYREDLSKKTANDIYNGN